jgi:hypothetical protein
MEELDTNIVFVVIAIAILVLKYFEARHYYRQEKQKQQVVVANLVRCRVEYDPNDSQHKMLYVFDRETDQFLTQAESVKQVVKNLVRQNYNTITFHPDHCPPDVFEASKTITADDFVEATQ